MVKQNKIQTWNSVLEVNAATTTKQTTYYSGDLIDVLVDPGDQTNDLICLMTRLEVKIEIMSPFWSQPKYLVVN